MQQGFGPLDVGVCCRDEALQMRIVHLLDDPFRIHFFDDVASLRNQELNLTCIIVAASARLHDRDGSRYLMGGPCGVSVPIVLLVDKLTTLPRRNSVAIENQEIEKDLRAAVRESAIRVASTELIGRMPLPGDLRQVLQDACYREPVPRSLKTALSRLRLKRQSVWKRFRKTVDCASPIPLKHMQEAIATVRCLSSKPRNRSWEHLANAHDFSLDWLRDSLRRQTGFRLVDLDESAVEYLQLWWLPKYLRAIPCGRSMSAKS